MSNDLHDLFKKELDQVPLRPANTWVPDGRRRPGLGGSSWRVPAAIAVAALVLIAALVGGRQLAALRDQSAATPGSAAGKAIYLSPSFNGSDWIQIDPETLADLSAKPLLDIAPTTANASDTQVSPDGSTIIVGDYGSLSPARAIYDARTGALRGYLVPEVAMVTDFLSADGTVAMGRLGNNNNTMTDAKAIISVADGHLIRTVPPGPIGDVQAIPVARDLSEIYYVMVSAALSAVSVSPGFQPYSLVVQSTVTGALSAPVALPGIAAGTTSKSDPAGRNAPIPFVPLAVRPAIAITADGRQLAALSYDGLTLDLVDLRTLVVTTVRVHVKTSLLDLLRPSIAAAKSLIDQEQRGMEFTPDGSALIVAINETHYDDLTGPRRSSRGMQRIDVATGLISAETSFTEGIFGSRITPDGKSVLLIVRPPDSAPPVYSLRRLDAQSLELKAERTLPDYAELQVVMARVAVSRTGAAPTPPTATQPSRTYCGRPTLEVLVESYFRSYNAHDVQGVLSLFNFRVSAAGGGFSSYYDNPGEPNDLRDADGLAAYLQARFALDDRFTQHSIQYPPSPYISDRGNPTATFTRTFSGLTRSGSMQFDCNADRLVHMRLSSQ